MADSDRNEIPSGLNRIRTRRVTSEDQSSSGGDDSPAIAARLIPNRKVVDDRKGAFSSCQIFVEVLFSWMRRDDDLLLT